MKKRYVYLLLLFLIFWGCTKEAAAPLEKQTVGYRDLQDRITQTGEVKPLLKVDIQSEASGKIEKIYVKEGQRVSKGDKLLEIDPYRLQIRRKKLVLQRKKANVELRSSRRELKRNQKLATSGTVADYEIDKLKDRVELARIAVNEAQLELNDIDEQLSKTVVISPLNGVVTDLPVEEGEIAVSATTGFQGGTELATVSEIENLEIVSRIGEADYTQLTVGQRVTIRPEAVTGTSTSGEITFIALSAKKEQGEELGSFEVRIKIDSLIAGIAPGINVNVDFILFEKKQVLAVPAYMVKKSPRGTTVCVSDGSEFGFTERKVKLGATDYRNYEILEGLSKGEVVVLPPEAPKKKRRKGGKGA